MHDFLLGPEWMISLLAKWRLNGHVVTHQVNSREGPGVIGYMACQVRAQSRPKGLKVAATNGVFVAAKPHQEESSERVHMSDGRCFPRLRHPSRVREYCA